VEVTQSLRLRDVVSLLLIASLASPVAAFAQQSAPGQQPPQQQPQQSPKAEKGNMGGIAGGLGAPAQHDAQNRPITAGGFVDNGPMVFEDITRKAGLAGWVHKMGSLAKNLILETNGSGVCLVDFDNDGWLDIYLVNGATFDSLDGKEPM